jgi:hypothetical protein
MNVETLYVGPVYSPILKCNPLSSVTGLFMKIDDDGNIPVDLVVHDNCLHKVSC